MNTPHRPTAVIAEDEPVLARTLMRLLAEVLRLRSFPADVFEQL
mgnify:CR=1 FL=1